jgi:hypothetical protein
MRAHTAASDVGTHGLTPSLHTVAEPPNIFTRSSAFNCSGVAPAPKLGNAKPFACGANPLATGVAATSTALRTALDDEDDDPPQAVSTNEAAIEITNHRDWHATLEALNSV